MINSSSLRRSDLPQGAYADRREKGIEIHKAIEQRIETGIIAPGRFSGYVKAVESFLPIPGEFYGAEEYFEIDSPAGRINGVMDLVLPERNPPEIYDWKTTKKQIAGRDLKDVLHNTQTTFYSKVLSDHLNGSSVRFTAVFIKVNDPEPKRPRIKPVSVLLDRSTIDRLWKATMTRILDRNRMPLVDEIDYIIWEQL